MSPILSKDFLAQFPDTPDHMNALGRFVFYRTYSRYLDSEKRRESYKEVCARVVEYSMGLESKHLEEIGYKVDREAQRREGEKLFSNMFNLRQFPSGRTMWIGGTSAAEKTKLGNFNCSFLNIKSWNDLSDLFYMLLVGTGVGFKCTKKMARQIPKVRVGVKLEHSDYKPLSRLERLEQTVVSKLPNGYAKIYVGDSKEAWSNALKEYFEILTNPECEFIHTVKISYNSIRPFGERLKTFGGQASGYKPLMEMFDGIDRVLKNKMDSYLLPIETDEKGYGHVRPIHILDIGNLIGHNVVVGGVRRTAEIFLFDEDDYECMFAKYGINGFWTEEALENHRQLGAVLLDMGIEKPEWFDSLQKIGDSRPNLYHRYMSNNSIAFNKKPSRDILHLAFRLMKDCGEPGFINLEEANRRRPNCEGINPCAEILLDSYGVCNLTTVNIMGFVREEEDPNNPKKVKVSLDLEELLEAQRLSARIGLRMTLVTLELPHWDFIQKRDRLVGTSLTGVKDAMERLEYSLEQEIELVSKLGEVAKKEVDTYAKHLRVNCPLLTTTVKPEGTLSQVSGGVSPGLHFSHSPYYIRRIRINKADPLCEVIMKLGWPVNPENGTPGETREEKLANARTIVVDFPVKSGSKKTKHDITVKEQFDTYFNYQNRYTDHNSSNTITVHPHEWAECEEIIWNNWDSFVGTSFLQIDGGSYSLAPYETIDEKSFEELDQFYKKSPLDVSLLWDVEREILEREDTLHKPSVDFSTGKIAGGCIDDLDSSNNPIDEEDEEVTTEVNDECAGGACPVR